MNFTLIATAVFAFGCIIGSFLNVVILRYNTGMTLRGRSRCFLCGRTLRLVELIPVFSFIIGRGRCIRCRARISFQYPLVELLTGVLFLALFFKFLFSVPSPYFILYTLYSYTLFSLLLVITVYDLRHKIIPDGPVYAFAALAFLGGAAAISAAPHFPAFLIAGPVVALPLFLLWLVSRGRWIGLGDAKLALGIGWLLGISDGFSALIFGFWIGAAVGLLLILAARLRRAAFFRGLSLSFALKNLTIKSEIPFAPFLILGTFLVFYFGISPFTLFSGLF